MNNRWIAPDARVLVDAFRAAGGASFQDVSVEQARASYEMSCAANGLDAVPLNSVEEHVIARDLRVRLYRPTLDRCGAILFFHGGGWVVGSLATHDAICRALAARSGLAVVAVDYRLAPEHPYPAAIDDARRALAWLRRAASGLGLKEKSFYLAGDSAGGQLAAVLGHEEARWPEPGGIGGLVLLYPVTDLAMSTDSYARVSSGFPLTAATMRWFIDHYVPPGIDRLQPALSPIRHLGTSPLPPTFICTVDNDPLADEGIAFAARCASIGTEVEHVHLAGYAHGLFTSAGRLPRGERMLDRVAAFLADLDAPVST